MRGLLLLAAASLLTALVLTDDSGPVCVTGDFKWKDCNLCKCNQTGRWHCSKDECPTTKIDPWLSARRSDRFECAPSSTFKDRCETPTFLVPPVEELRERPIMPLGSAYHIASENLQTRPLELYNGHPLYRSIGPYPMSSIRPTDSKENQNTLRSGPYSPRMRACIPDSHFKVDCNWCSCSKDGMQLMCTEAECTSTSVKEPLINRTSDGNKEKGQYCVPSTTFKDKCNLCKCSDDGKFAMCTMKLCDLEYEPANEVGKKIIGAGQRGTFCEPNTVFKLDCNTCVCNEDGTDAACTHMFCGNLDSEEQRGEVRKKGSRARQRGTHCQPKTSFKRDCNTCVCNEDGTAAACTLMFCGNRDPKEQTDEVRKKGSRDRLRGMHCQPNTSFKVDCNTCVCNEDGTSAACTLKICGFRDRKEQTDEERRKRVRAHRPGTFCEPNASFKIDCNTCVCNEDGTNAACTLMSCVNQDLKEQTAEVKTKSVRARQRETFCEPNASFKLDCNTCICNEDGTKAHCTLVFCGNRDPKDIIPMITSVDENRNKRYGTRVRGDQPQRGRLPDDYLADATT